MKINEFEIAIKKKLEKFVEEVTTNDEYLTNGSLPDWDEEDWFDALLAFFELPLDLD